MSWDIDPDPLRVRVADGQLFARWWPGEVVCTPLSSTSFVSTFGLIEFEVAEDGSVSVVVAGKGARQYRVPDGV